MTNIVKAIWNNKVIAEAEKDDLIYIEGNWYFPKNSVNAEYLKQSVHHTTCHWKGEASYYNVDVGGNVNQNGAWYYPDPTPSAITRLKKDFSNYVAFWNGIQVG